MNGTAWFMEYTRTTTSLNAAILMILFFHSTTGTFVIFRKVGVLPGSTIFVDLSVAYDFGLLGFHRLRWTGFCKQNDVFHCVLQVQNTRNSSIHFQAMTASIQGFHSASGSPTSRSRVSAAVLRSVLSSMSMMSGMRFWSCSLREISGALVSPSYP